MLYCGVTCISSILEDREPQKGTETYCQNGLYSYKSILEDREPQKGTKYYIREKER